MSFRHSDSTTGTGRYTALFFLVLATRLPFLWQGPGLDNDAWLLIATGQDIFERGAYQVSRLPGYPVLELLYSLCTYAPLWVFSLGSALASAVAGLLLFSLLRRLHCPYPFVSSLAVCMLPIMYIHSTTAMDYLWALVFILGSLQSAFGGSFFVAGLATGLAAGCRPTSLLIMAALLLYVWRRNRPAPIRSLLLYGCGSALTLGLCFAPVVGRYGCSFLRPDNPVVPPWQPGPHVHQLFGVLGSAALLFYMGALVWDRLRPPHRRAHGLRPHLRLPETQTLLFALCLFVLTYLVWPFESAYLIPVLPLLALLAGPICPAQAWKVILVLCLASGLVLRVDRESGPALGGQVLDHAARSRRMYRTVTALHRSLQALGPNSRVIAGLYSQALDALHRPGEPRPWCDLLSPRELKEYVDQGGQLFYLPDRPRIFMGVRTPTLARYGYDLRLTPARPFPVPGS